ncbi:DUF2336 domain-containing protein [Kiloniella laminariae]|uniref:DUF2336 domain-containing protein n=1 Tax=Kiloniella laminariae TaxID=454162 RepID=UPI0003A6911C|nr:DUF2336 domain-containing protein [Kiloniella laminariae]
MQTALVYETAKEMAESKDPEVRLTLAKRNDTRPEFLYFLAEDESPEIRKAVASNATTPSQADLLLARDKDALVREQLAEKIAKLAPELDSKNQRRAHEFVVKTLQILVEDQQEKVRQILSVAVKDLDTVPVALVRKLAADSEDSVAVPVLQFSPILTDDDLLKLIWDGVRGARLKAISRRSNLGEQVTDAIIETEDGDAIAALLDNHSAQIREETLDMLVDKAPAVQIWHKPLVTRPKLSSLSIKRLATFVTENLLEALLDRPGMDPETATAIGLVVRQRLDEENVLDDKGTSEHEEKALVVEVEKLDRAGKLTEDRITTRLHCGDREFAIHALALKAALPPKVARRMILSRAAKTVVALVWKAGFTMELASLVQLRLAGIPPQQSIKADSEGQVPISEKELDWQVTLYLDNSE